MLPDYTPGEELFHSVSHIVGGALGVVALALCVTFAALRHNPWAVVGGAIYGASLVILYTMSSVYHGLHPIMAKKVMQVLDHCAINVLIGGTYTPVLLCALRPVSPGWAWSLFGVVWGLCILSTVFTAIDLHKYAKLSMLCYLGVGWCIMLAVRPTLEALTLPGLLWMVGGGVAYTLGAVLYGMGTKVSYAHATFHVFTLIGSIMQFISIFFYIIL
jgi:hemolysin III